MLRLGLTLVLVTLTVAGCGGVTPPVEPIPDQFYARHDDPLPKGTQVVTRNEFDRRVASGELEPVSQATMRLLEEAAARQEAEDEATIRAFEEAHPELGGLMPEGADLNNPSVSALADGNYLHTVELRSGESREVVTMGPRWQKRMIAAALRSYPTRANQMANYSLFFEGLPERWREQLDLPDPVTVASEPDIYPAAEIEALNLSITENTSAILASIEPPPPPPPPPFGVSDCSGETGFAGGSDAVGSSDTHPDCALRADGIYRNFDWSLKPYLTCVKDQGRRGTCTGFANTSAIEMAVARTHGVWANLSEQAYYNRAHRVWDPLDFGDGLMSELGFTGMYGEAWLIPFENQWTYNPSLSRIDHLAQCKAACSDGPDGAACQVLCEFDPQNRRYTNSCVGYAESCSDSTHQSPLVCTKVEVAFKSFWMCAYADPNINPNSQGYRIKTSSQFWDAAQVEHSFAQILLALAFLKNPVVIGHPVTPSFDAAWETGFAVYPGAGESNSGGHGMHVVGFIDNATLAKVLPSAPAGAGGGYLIIKNSWSNCWGDGGLLYLSYQSVKDHTPDATVLHGVK